MTSFLFAYGSLQPDKAPPSIRPVAERFRHVGHGSVPGHLYELGPYRGAVPDPTAATAIQGEVYELPDDAAVLPALDAYEEYDPASAAPSVFVRARVAVRLDDGRALTCWMYRYDGPRP